MRVRDVENINELRIEKQALLQHERTKNAIPANGRTQTEKTLENENIVTMDTCGVEFQFYNYKSSELKQKTNCDKMRSCQ